MSPKIKHNAKSTRRVKRKDWITLSDGEMIARCTMSRQDIEDTERIRRILDQAVGIKQADGGQIVEDSVRERDVVIAIDLVNKLHRTMRDIHNGSRDESRKNSGGGGGGSTPSGIFHRLVDEDQMSDCILSIKNSYFHDEKEIEICKKKCNLYDFFMLVHYYFNYIGILENNSQLAFSKYLNKKVFGGNETINVRTLNNYTKMNAYQNFEKLLSTNRSICFDWPPESSLLETENFLLNPFQHIGWKFQHSRYFNTLKNEKKRVQEFIL